MKTASEASASSTAFPAIFSKMQSSSFFSSANLLKTLNPESQSETQPITYDEILSSIKLFKPFLIEYYKFIDLDPALTATALQEPDYLLSLLNCVSHKGGWTTMIGRNYWSCIPKHFNSLQPWKLRQDYDKFLFTFEKTWNPLSKYDNETIENFLQEIDSSIVKSCEFYRPSMLVNEMTAAVVQSFFEADSIVIPGMANHILKINLEGFSIESLKELNLPLQYNDINFSLDKLLGLEDFYTEFPLSLNQALYNEISEHLLCPMHWNSVDNLLRYTPDIPGLSSPLVLLLKNSFFCIGGQSYTSLNGLYITLYGHCEWVGIPQSAMNALTKKVHKEQGVDLFDGSWKPDEKYLLINGIEFFYVLTKPGDIFIAKSDTVYWVSSDLSVVCQWFVYPKSRINQVSSVYNNTKDKKHKINLPLLAVEYLNTHLPDVDADIFSIFKRIFVESIDDDCWKGNFIIETEDKRSCCLCGQDLVWRYSRCNKCRVQQDMDSLCLKCVKSHKCSDFEYLEKFSPVELDKFYMRLDKPNEKSEFQPALCKILVKEPQVGCGNSVMFDPDYNQSDYEFFMPKIDCENLMTSNNKGEDNMKSLSSLDIDACYKRKGLKKQKIREAMQNPLSGPRFNYIEEEKKQTQKEDMGRIELPMTRRNRTNPLSSLVKSKNDTSLSSLIRVDRKKELQLKKNTKIAKNDPSQKSS
ncbi:hypothetical protein SteCoe_8487 [Stentor coeruleus]|uniref:JmjC domain-containing protein n=1 Tax=Stentor coeruleus TaxID=5963 RepID=A0A1R2CK95_9CILI|nr:hypothetical protein SteCoe_8487 [Stentor coeruleus]